MVRKSLAVFCFVFASTSAVAKPPTGSGSVEVMSKIDSEHVGVIFDTSVALKYDYGLAFESFFMVSETWGQAYFGPAWRPTDWLKFSLSVGGQQMKGEVGWRYATSLWVGNGTASTLVIVELDNPTFMGDKSGLFYLIKATYQPTTWFSTGLVDRRGAGIGPKVAFSIPHTTLTTWCEWTFLDPEELDGELIHLDRFVIGLNVAF